MELDNHKAGSTVADAGKPCSRLDAAYAALRTAPGKENYIAFVEAFAADLADDAYVFVPAKAAMPVAAQKDGKIQWAVVGTPQGKMLAVFTNREEVEKHPAPASVGVKMRACFREALANKEIAGVLVNPMDGHHGVPIERRNLEVMAGRMQSGAGAQMPQLGPGVVSNAVYRLWDIAVGVPTAVYDVSAEVEKLGGMEKILKPLLAKWQVALKDDKDAQSFPEPMDYAKAVLNDVVSCGFVYGAMALKTPELAQDVDIDRCIDAIRDLRDDIRQNLDEYLVLISDAIRSDMYEPNERQLQLLVVGNLPIIAFGAFSFGLGWGMAKNAESEGVTALADLRDRQQAWIEKFKNDVVEKLEKERKAKEEKQNEEGE